MHLPPLRMIHLEALGQFISKYPLVIIVCMVAYQVIGGIWYGPLFKKSWSKLTGIDKVKPKNLKKPMIIGMCTGFVTSFVQTVILGRTMQITSMGHWSYALMIATLLWFPFIFLVMAQGYAYSMRSWKLLLIDSGYLLVALWAIALILFVTIL